jgi:Icc-related predicted phosphoesterase
MKFACISDTHCKDLRVILKGIEADCLIIAGDWSFRGTFKEQVQFIDMLNDVRTKFRHVVWTNGNHELGLEGKPERSREIAEATDSIYLEDSCVSLPKYPQSDGPPAEVGDRSDYIKIFGSPYTPEFYNWAFMYPRGTDRWKCIPANVDIVVTHGPAYKHLDLTDGRYHLPEHVGCYDLARRLEEIKPKVHVAGHIHSAHGAKLVKWDERNMTYFYNVAICDEDYMATNPVTEFEVC